MNLSAAVVFHPEGASVYNPYYFFFLKENMNPMALCQKVSLLNNNNPL